MNMTNDASTVHTSEIVDADAIVTLEELCSCCSVEPDWIAQLVENGAIETVNQHKSDWQFTRLTIVRVAKARRLERDLSLNTPGIALALELLDEIEHLRSRLRAFADDRELRER